MSNFPVTNSNLSAPHLAAFLQRLYAFSNNIACKLIRAGINDTYLVTDGEERYVFRVYSLNWRTRTEIDEEIRLLNLLKTHQISISYPIADRENQFIQTLNAPEGDRLGVLFSYAKGEKLHSFPAETHYVIGQLMARLHAVTQDLSLQRVTYTPDVLVGEPLEQIAKFLSADAPEMAYMQTLQKHLLDVLQNAAGQPLRQGAVHLDIWFDNLNIDREGNATIFDFDFCGNGWLCLDVAYYMLQLHNVERDEAECATKLQHFFEGYETITPLTETERALFPALGISIYFFYLGVQCRRYDNWSNSFLSESYLKRFINALVKRYADIHGIVPSNPV